MASVRESLKASDWRVGLIDDYHTEQNNSLWASTWLERGLEAVHGLRARLLNGRASGQHTLAKTDTAGNILAL